MLQLQKCHLVIKFSELRIRKSGVSRNYRIFNPLKPSVWERLILPGGALRNEGVSGEQDFQSTIFNTYEIRIGCKI